MLISELDITIRHFRKIEIKLIKFCKSGLDPQEQRDFEFQRFYVENGKLYVEYDIGHQNRTIVLEQHQVDNVFLDG